MAESGTRQGEGEAAAREREGELNSRVERELRSSSASGMRGVPGRVGVGPTAATGQTGSICWPIMGLGAKGAASRGVCHSDILGPGQRYLQCAVGNKYGMQKKYIGITGWGPVPRDGH